MKHGHPRRPHLALYAGGDLGFLDRIKLRLHLSGCARCSEVVEACRLDRETLRTDAAALPTGFDWERLSAEMTANIRVGLAAGRCVEERKRAHTLLGGALAGKPAAAFASVAALLAGGWWLSYPAGPGGRMSNAEHLRRVLFERTTPAPYDNVITLGSTQDGGLEFKQNGAVLRIAHPGASPTLVTASTGGSVRARYIDDDTGQVTITNVYSQ